MSLSQNPPKTVQIKNKIKREFFLGNTYFWKHFVTKDKPLFEFLTQKPILANTRVKKMHFQKKS
jgi:hypothetical protein